MRYSGFAALVATLSFASPVLAGPVDLEQIIATTDALVAAPNGVPACFPDFAGPADVFVATAYKGAETLDRGTFGHAVGRTTVHVMATTNPVLVFATAYEPTLWSFVLDPGAKLAAVQIEGEYQPMVEGLPAGTPVGRTYFTDADERPGKVCGLPLTAEQQEAINQQIKAQRTRHEQLVSEESRKTIRAADYREFVRALSAKDVAPDTLAVARAIAASAADDAATAQQASRDALASIASLTEQLKGPPVKRLAHDYFYLDDPAELDQLAADLSRLGPYTIVSTRYGYASPSGGFEISDTVVAAERQNKADALATLAALQPPPSALLPAGVPRLAPPADLVPADGLQYLVDHGYAVVDPAWTKYVCDLRTAMARSKGLSGDACGEMYGTYLVLLGPITYPYGLYGANRGQFILPDGVAEPDGEIGHSELIRPKDILSGRDQRH